MSSGFIAGYFHFGIRILWQTLVVCLVLFALSVSVIREVLPKLDNVRRELVLHLEHEYGIQMHLGKLAAKWQHFGPVLTVNDLVIPYQDKLPVTMLIGKAQIKLNFWESLFTFTPQIEDVLFENVELALNIDKLSAISHADDKGKMDWLYYLLLEQLQRYSIANLKLQLISQRHHYRPIYLRSLNWINQDSRHRAQGSWYLSPFASEHEYLNLNLDLYGDGSTPDSITGQIYLAANNLDLGAWFSRQAKAKKLKTHIPLEGVVNLQAWLDIHSRQVGSAYVQLDTSYLKWPLAQETQEFRVKSGAFLWSPTTQGWQLQSQNLQLESNGKPWPEPYFAAGRQADALFLHTNPVLAETLSPLLVLLPEMGTEKLEQWQQLQPQGKLGPLDVYWPLDDSPRAKLILDKISWRANGNILGITALDASLGWQDNKLYFELPSQKIKADFTKGFKQPLKFALDKLQGVFDTDTKRLLVPNIKLTNEDIALDATARVDLSPSPFLALSANLQLYNAAKADNYYPLKAMKPNLVAYLTKALKQGRSHNAKILWNGALSDFPYQDHSGVFQAGFTLDKARFSFHPDWPAMTDLSLNALFENTRMDIWINKGKLLNLAVDGAHVFIPDLARKSTVKVEADLNSASHDVTQVIKLCPLKGSVGKVLDVVHFHGDIGTRLDLSFPLYKGGKNDIKGLLKLQQTPVYVTKPGVWLNNVSGKIAFHNQNLTADKLTALLFEQPLSLSLTGKEKSQTYGLDLGLNGHWQLDKLPKQLANPLSSYYQGELDWEGKLRMVFDATGYQIQAKVHSDLQGASLALPAPFTKTPDEKLTLDTELIGDNREINLGIKLGELAEFWGAFDQISGHALSHYDLRLGRLFQPGDALARRGGFIWLTLPEMSLAQWLPVIESFTSSTKQSTKTSTGSAPSLFPILSGIDGEIGHFHALGQTLTQFEFDALPTKHAWRVNAGSDQFIGRIDFYPDWHTQGLKLVASRMRLSKFEKTPSSVQLKLKDLPPIAVDVDNFHYDNIPLGHLEFQGNPDSKGYDIQTLSLNSPQASLTGKGRWLNHDTINRTQLDLKLTADKFDALTDVLGIDPGVKDAPLTINANLNWQGAPYHFSLDSLNGDMKFELGKGHLSQISDRGARIFSLFSLDSLVRKLSLDFSDVFGNGLYFNSFNGTLQIDNGVIKTRDAEMDAVAGSVKVRGYTDLRTESLNYDIRFVPRLASSVPTVVLLSTSAWTMGLGAFALTKVLEPVIEVISEIRFRLTGTMSSPKLEEVERKSKEIEIPEAALPAKTPDNKSHNQTETINQSTNAATKEKPSSITQ